jgi:CTP-dependent riboflavin kinase
VTSHGLALLVIARDPHVRMRDIAIAVGVTERTAQRVVTDLTNAGYILRERSHRRNVYTVRADLPFRLPGELEERIGELLAVLAPTVIAKAAGTASQPFAATEPMAVVDPDA